METSIIIILVVAAVVGIYALLILLDAIFVFSFNKILKVHQKGLTILLKNKLDNLNRIFTLLNKNNVVIQEDDLTLLASIGIKDLENAQSERCLNAIKNLSYLTSQAIFLIASEEKLAKHQELQMARNYADELETNYRSMIAMYNADILGYNYWIKFLPCRYIFKILKFKEKKII